MAHAGPHASQRLHYLVGAADHLLASAVGQRVPAGGAHGRGHAAAVLQGGGRRAGLCQADPSAQVVARWAAGGDARVGAVRLLLHHHPARAHRLRRARIGARRVQHQRIRRYRAAHLLTTIGRPIHQLLTQRACLSHADYTRASVLQYLVVRTDWSGVHADSCLIQNLARRA